jgi:hypothetical protein
MLRHEGIQFKVCKNPYVKCAVVERAHGTIRVIVYKYFTYKYTYSYTDVLPNLSMSIIPRFTRQQAWRLRE